MNLKQAIQINAENKYYRQIMQRMFEISPSAVYNECICADTKHIEEFIYRLRGTDMKRLLIVVDYQKDFVNGALGFAGAEKLEMPIADKITEYRNRGDEIVFTFDTHGQGYMTTQEGKNLPVMHCLEGSDGWQLYGRIGDLIGDKDMCFTKNTFGSAELFDYLRDREYESVELVGLVSNICVMANAVIAKTALPEVPVIIDAGCTDSFDKELNSKTFDILEGIHIKVINREELSDV